MQTVVPLLVACLITLPLFPHCTAEAAPPPVGLALSEVLPTNHDGLPDDAGAYPDWIELVNTSDHPISTDGFALSDDQEQPRRWPLPDMTIQPDGHLTIFASGRDQTHLPGSALPPRDVPGLTAWLSTRDGLTPVPGQPDRIGTWYDVADPSMKAVQLNANQAPRLEQDPLTGAPLLAFDGGDDHLTLQLPETAGPFTLFCIAQPLALHEIDSQSPSGVDGTTGQRYLFGAEHGGDYEAGLGVSLGTNGISVYEHGSGYMPALAVLETRFDDGLQVFSVTVNEQQPTIGLNGNPGAQGFRSARDRTTAPVRIGLGPYGAFQGRIAEFLLYARALTESERQGVEAYLARRWALTLHPVLHASFSIENGRESVLLTNRQGEIVDFAPARPTPPDVSIVRDPAAPEQWVYSENPTPGEPNQGPYKTSWMAPPTFSHSGGYYESAFVLQLTAADPEAEIYFTNDGTEPTTESRYYRAGLSIRNRSSAQDVLALIPTGGGWQPPSEPGFKATVLRARTFKEGAIASETVTRTFMVRPEPRFTMPVISLVTEPDNFFSPERGIYVSGVEGQGNFWQRGRAWERPVHIELFEPDGALAFAQDAAVRIHGGTSRQFPQKNLRLYGRNARGDAPFEYQLFPDRPIHSFKRFLLRGTGHDHFYAFSRDPLMQAIVAELDLDIQACRPAIILINGEYWGIQNIRESLDEHYIESHFGHDSNAVDILEGYGSVNEGSGLHYEALLAYVRDHDLTEPMHYQQVQAMMEIENYIDYRAAEIFFYRWDMGNIKFWRPQTEDGRWRWFLFDTDVGYGGFAAVPNPWTFDMIAYEIEPNGPWTHLSLNDHNNPTATFLLRNLLLNEEFKSQFIQRYNDLLNSTFQPARALALIDGFQATLAPEMPAHINRWRTPGSIDEWLNHVEGLRQYARRRPQHARQHLREHFNLETEVRLNIHAGSSAGGGLQINSLELTPAAAAEWSGVFFRNLPITLKATPQPGYSFDSWIGLPGVTTPEVVLRLKADLDLQPVFKPVPPPPGPVIHSAEATGASQLKLQASGSPGRFYEIQWSADHQQWQTISRIQADANGAIEVVLPVLPQYRRGFYRLAE